MRLIYLSGEKTESDLGPMHGTGIVKITVVSNSGEKIWRRNFGLQFSVFPLNIQSAHNKCEINVAQSSK